MKTPPQWSEERLEVDAEAARDLFREDRLGESIERWNEVYVANEAVFEHLMNESLVDRLESLSPEEVGELFRSRAGDALRYIAGPPISHDDLKVLARTSLAPSRIAGDQEAASRIVRTILRSADASRFPWLDQGRKPTEEEKRAAISASAALLTYQQISTERRNEGKENQESSVRMFLVGSGLSEVPPRPISTLSDAPNPGQFCGESMVGTKKADICVRLYDGRLMPIECKVSNSATNSVKRINNDAQVKAVRWTQEFGTMQVVPAAVLSGVFRVHNLLQAQDAGLHLFWAHDLNALKTFIETSLPDAPA